MNLSRPTSLATVLRHVVLFGALAVSPVVIAEETARLEMPKSAEKAAYSTQPVCKREAVIGTKISKTVCKTRAQRDDEREGSRDFLDRVQQSATVQAKTMQ